MLVLLFFSDFSSKAENNARIYNNLDLNQILNQKIYRPFSFGK